MEEHHAEQKKNLKQIRDLIVEKDAAERDLNLLKTIVDLEAHKTTAEMESRKQLVLRLQTQIVGLRKTNEELEKTIQKLETEGIYFFGSFF